MILTVTLNPALDITYTVGRVINGGTNRVRDVSERPGGKGLNVAHVLRTLGAPARAIGLAGGHTGERILDLLSAADLDVRFAPVAAESRRTVVVTDGIDATGFWEPGPRISPAEWAAFGTTYREALAGVSLVVLAGSLPPGLPDDAYATLITIAREAGVATVLDADGPALRAGLAAAPTMVKPNATELAAAAGRAVNITSDAGLDGAIAAVRAVRAGGQVAVVASLGAAGLIASTPAGEWRAAPPRPLTGNPTGAGDACVAALAIGLLNATPWPQLLADAVACSCAAVAAPVAGVVDPRHIRRLRPTVIVEEI